MVGGSPTKPPGGQPVVVALAVAGGGYLLHKVFRRGKRKEDDQHHDEPEPVASTSSQQSAQIEIVHERTFRHHRVVNVHLRLGAYLLLLAALVLAINKRMWDVTCALFSLGLFLLVEEWRVSPHAAIQESRKESGKPRNSIESMCGEWVKDFSRSDRMDEACDAMRLNGLVRSAIRLVRGVEIAVRDGEFKFAVCSVIPWFKVRESYPLCGEPRCFRRRDLRRGKHTAHVQVLGDGGVALHAEWGEPLGGSGTDEFRLTGPDEMAVSSTIRVGGRAVSYRMVYVRRGALPAAAAAAPQ